MLYTRDTARLAIFASSHLQRGALICSEGLQRCFEVFVSSRNSLLIKTEKLSSCGLGAVDEDNMTGCSLYNFHGLPVNIKDVTSFVPLSRLSAVLATFTNLNVVASLTGARTI